MANVSRRDARKSGGDDQGGEGAAIPVTKPKRPVRTAQPRTANARTAPQPERRQGPEDGEKNYHAEEDEGRGRRVDDSHEITRKSRGERQVERFAVPSNWKKSGWDYQFWVETVMGQNVESTSEIFDGGWRPVYWKDVPQPWPPGAKGDEQVKRGGQALYLRPKRLTDEAKREEYEAAERQKLDRLQAASSGRVAGGGGINDVRGVVAHPLQIEVEGEVGVHHPKSRD